MLQKSKEISLTGSSVIDGQTVVQMNARISANSMDNYVNQSVVNVDLYNENRKQVRKDLSDFQDFVYDNEDALASDLEAEATENTEK